MKAVVLAGGLGTRLAEETDLKPKPMVEIGGRPILWHIMKIYSSYGINDFIICLGYRGYLIKEFFANYMLHTSDVTMDIQNNTFEILHRTTEPWKVTLVDTGAHTNTAGRVKRVEKYLDEEDFCLTYGDGVADINLESLLEFHNSNNGIGTISAVKPPGRYGALDLSEAQEVLSFHEKPLGDNSWINGGFMVFKKDIFKFISGDNSSLESDVLVEMARTKTLNGFKHAGFWQAMDTLRDKNYLNQLWEENRAPWKSW
jgi:glucose-1-phosphate cytidylyltransferase